MVIVKSLNRVIFLLAFLVPLACLGQRSVLWKETFEQEDFWGRWHGEGAIWTVGSPSSGPDRAFAGTNCAATILDGDYPPTVDARLIRDRVFIVPDASTSPRLRFWQWFKGGPGATRSVEIRSSTGAWQDLRPTTKWIDPGWSQAWVDLSQFSGQAVQIAFRFQADGQTEVSAGWYLDEVQVEAGATGLAKKADGFESGLGDWTTDQAVWQVGAPRSGPGRAFMGTNCLATVLDGTYPPATDARVVSGEFPVPAAAENPRLRFWHWFSLGTGDSGRVEIMDSSGRWQALSQDYLFESGAWSRPSLSLIRFAGQVVRIAFRFQSNSDADVRPGWFLDEAVVETGATDWDGSLQSGGFESGLSEWAVDNGVWEVGNPTAGPSHSFGGEQCAGTVLTGNYPALANSRLISPEIDLSCEKGWPALTFEHWEQIGRGAQGTVEIRELGGRWTQLGDPISGSSSGWTAASYGLSDYVGKRVQIAFRFRSDSDAVLGSGWFIDEVQIRRGAGFESTKRTVHAGTSFIEAFPVSCSNIQWVLGPDAPPGMSLDPTSATLTWSPTEAQAPGLYRISICAVDLSNQSVVGSCGILELLLLEANRTPVVTQLEPQAFDDQGTLQISISASDVDIPAQKLTFTLEPGSPDGASINAATGLFTWTPTPAQPTKPYQISVRVSDDGDPVHSAVMTFAVVPRQLAVGAVQLQVTRLTTGSASICLVGGTAANAYYLEVTEDLSSAEWRPVESNSPDCSTVLWTTGKVQFYRARTAQ